MGLADVMQPDSRLLSNLIAQEKEHAKQLAALFPVVNAALASLSAYATASGPPAQSIATVVHAFAAADDALHHRYAYAIDAWRAQLIALKDLEDDLTAVLRDRDILVTRLLKVSKSTRDTHCSSSTLGISDPFCTYPSSNAKTAAVAPFALMPVPVPGNTNTKLAQAQAELQACEAHLVFKERELDVRRIAVMHDGLGERCRALIDCAAMWAEMGKQGLRALQALGQNRNQSHINSRYHRNLGANSVSKPLPTLVSTHFGTRSAHPSDSTSQMATRSTEVSHGSPPSSKQHPNPPEESKPRSELKPQFESEVQLAQRLNPNADTDADAIALPPAHTIPELTVPTDVHSRSPSSDDHSTPATATQQRPLSKISSAPSLRRSNNKLSDQFSDENSDAPSLAPHHPRHSRSTINATKTSANTTLPVLASGSLSPQAFPTRDTSNSEEFNDGYGDPSDGHPNGGPFQVAENDPFEVIRRSTVISPRASVVAPNTATDELIPPNALVLLNTPRARTGLMVSTSAPAHTSAPGVHMRVGDLIAGSASKSVFGPVSGPTPTLAQPQPTKRERQTSAFLGSLRGLFQKPNKPEGEQQQKKRGRWAVIEREDSDERGSHEPSGRASTVARAEVNWRRGAGGGRGGGWITRTDGRIQDGRHADEDSDTTSASNTVTSTTGLPSILRGQGHRNGSGNGNGDGPMLSISVHVSKTVRVDGWVTDDPVGVGASSKAMGMAPRMGTGATGLGQSRTARRNTTRRPKTSVADLRGSDQGQSDGEEMVGNEDEDEQLWVREEISTNADPGLGAPLPKHAVKTKHRRSASLSEVDVYLAMLPSAPTPSQTPVPSRPPTRTPSSASSSSPKPHAHMQHVENQSLMSIVADVTGQHPHSRQDGDRGGAMKTTNVRGHAGSACSPESGRSDAEGGQGRGEGLMRMQLRSALRNASRTPSPGPVPVVTPVVPTTTGTVVPRGGAAADERNRVRRSWRDSASVSSYATGRESFDGEVQQLRVPSPSGLRSRSPVSALAEPLITILPPQPVEPPVVVGNGHANPNANLGSNTTVESLPPSLTVSTETDTTPTVKARRKSVRVSLQPTFSPTPPALFDEDDEDGEGNALWSRAFSIKEEDDWARDRRDGKPEDVWADLRG